MPQPVGPVRRVLTSYPVRLLAVLVGLVVVVLVWNRVIAPPAQPPAAAAPPATAGQIGSGVWLVGTDVAPGTYRSAGATDGYCMWSRHNTVAGGPMDGIIASDGAASGPMLVTIAAGDKTFRTRGCAPFTKVG